jgi:Flp pilus assembly pilin Flp
MIGRAFENFGLHLSRWALDEDGNATVEWVLLVGGLVGLSVVVLLSIGGGVEELATRADDELSARDVTTTY